MGIDPGGTGIISDAVGHSCDVVVRDGCSRVPCELEYTPSAELAHGYLDA